MCKRFHPYKSPHTLTHTVLLCLLPTITLSNLHPFLSFPLFSFLFSFFSFLFLFPPSVSAAIPGEQAPYKASVELHKFKFKESHYSKEKKMKKCELCSKVARMYCESDKASLCWDCDSRVHAANFLVAKHTRTLLCNSCQSPTPWTGSGPKLGPTVSVCEACDNREATEDEDEDEDDDDDDDDSENGDLVHEDEDEEEDDDGENQVVPLSLPPSSSSASASTSASTSLSYSSEESSAIRDGLFASSSEDNVSFFNHVNGREEEENGGRNVRSWRWR